MAWVRLPGTEQCIGGPELARAIEERLGRPVFVPVSRAGLAIEGRIEPKKQGFRAVLTIADAGGAQLGTRELATTSTDCRALDRTLVLVAALLIDPEAMSEPAPSPSPVVEPAPSAAPTVEPAPSPTPAQAAAPIAVPGGWSFELEGNALISAGRVDVLTPGAQLVFSASPSALWFGGAAIQVFGGQIQETPQTGVAVVAISGALRFGIRVLLSERWRWRSFVDTELGAAFASPSGFLARQEQVGSFGQSGLGTDLSVLLGSAVRLSAGLHGGIPWNRVSFLVSGAGGQERVISRTSPLTGDAWLGASVDF
ncbi:MAG: hypothetical protein U1E65_15560 [Myxococcota bacterium]